MGYYSDFYYEVDNSDVESDKDVMEFLTDNKDIDDGYDTILYTIEGESTKFYEYKEAMVKLSKQFRDKVFMVYRVGEGEQDIEKSYFKNGKSVHYTPEIVWPEFNEDELE